MFITQYQVNFLMIVYLAIVIIFAVAILNDPKTSIRLKALKLILLIFIPVLGILILSADFFYNKFIRSKANA